METIAFVRITKYLRSQPAGQPATATTTTQLTTNYTGIPTGWNISHSTTPLDSQEEHRPTTPPPPKSKQLGHFESESYSTFLTRPNNITSLRFISLKLDHWRTRHHHESLMGRLFFRRRVYSFQVPRSRQIARDEEGP